MTAEISPALKQKCLDNMELFQISEDVRKLCLDGMHLEYEMNTIYSELQKKFFTSTSHEANLSTNLDDLSMTIQTTLGDFRRWSESLKCMSKSSSFLPPLLLKSSSSVKEIKAPYFLKSQEFAIKEGEMITIMDTSQEDSVKVKVGDNREGMIPILSLLMPSSDYNLTSLFERLRVQLLCSWFECFRLFYRRLFHLLLALLKHLAYIYPTNVSLHATGPSTSKDLKVLKKIVARLVADFLGDEEPKMVDERIGSERNLVTKLSSAYQNYQVFEQMFKMLGGQKEKGKTRPLCIFDKLSEFQSKLFPQNQNEPIKYYKTKIIIESVETREEISHYPGNGGSNSSVAGSEGIGHQQMKVESEQLTSSSQEVKQRFVIKSIVDPRDGKEISLDDAMKEGVMDMTRGFYVDPRPGGKSKPISMAMNEGLIKVETVSEMVTEAKVEEMGMITVKSLLHNENEKKEYKIIGATDPLSAEKLSPEEAKKRGWLTDSQYKLESKVITLEEAIEIGWVQVEYLPVAPSTTSSSSESVSEPAYETRTYLIRSVVHSGRSKPIGFSEAVRLGLIDVDHGCYVDYRSRDKMSLDEALRRGLVKGRQLRDDEDHGSLAIDPGNRVVAKNLTKVKKIVGAMTAYSKIAAGGKKKKTVIHGDKVDAPTEDISGGSGVLAVVDQEEKKVV